jgi:hypothetical protein
MVITPKGILISWSEFDALPEYSCSIPTGTTVGKKWKRPVPYEIRTDPPNTWVLGEYVECSVPGEIGIEWTPLILPENSHRASKSQ